MKTIKIFSLALVSMFAAVSLVSCSDACEYTDTKVSPLTFDGTHPEDIANTSWVRAEGVNKNVYGESVQGFVESINFVRTINDKEEKLDSCVVKMSKGSVGSTDVATWSDDSNTEKVPAYVYTYSSTTGNFEIKKAEKDDKGKVTLKVLFTGVVGKQKKTGRGMISIVHYNDIPNTTYLLQQ